MKKQIFLAAIVLLSACTMPDMNAGKRAYDAGNYKVAQANYSELAEFGVPRAKTELGKMYLNGKGVAPDAARALKLFKEASAEGDRAADTMIPKAQLKLARAKLDSEDPQVRSQGVVRLKELAKANNPIALYQLGQLYEKGGNVPKDLDLAADYYTRANKLGYARAGEKLTAMQESKPVETTKSPQKP